MAESKGISRTGTIFLILGAFFLVFHVMGMLFPIDWWGIHSLAYLPLPLSFVFVIASAAWIFFPRQLPDLPTWGPARKNRWLVPLGLALFASVFFYNFPIHKDTYGDAPTFIRDFERVDKGEIPIRADLILDPNIFHSKNGEYTVLNLVGLIRDAFDLDTQHAFMLFDAICGFLFIFLWGMFIFRYFEPGWLRNSVLFVIATAPFLQVFFGHIEVYAPAMLMLSAYMMALVHYLQTRSRKWLIWLGILLVLCLKLHSSAFLLIPSFLFALSEHGQKPGSPRRITLRNLLLMAVLPVFLGGTVLYFFILKDHNDPRFYIEGVEVMDRVFLPMFSPDPPLDRYNLFSLNHIWDYFNIMLVWSAGALKIILGIILTHRKEVNWQNPALMLTGLTLFFFTIFFFFVNPLLGMQFDWDLLSIPAPVFLMFMVLLVHSIRDREVIHKLCMGSAAISFLGITIFWVNAEASAYSERLEDLGIRTYETYWTGSSKVIWKAWEYDLANPEALLKRSDAALERMRKSALPANDQEFAVLHQKLAMHYRKAGGDYVNAEFLHRESIRYSPPDSVAVHYIGLMESLFMQGKYKDAYEAAKVLAAEEHPTYDKSQRIALHCALKAGLRNEALTHLNNLYEAEPENLSWREMVSAVDSGATTADLLLVFEGPKK